MNKYHLIPDGAMMRIVADKTFYRADGKKVKQGTVGGLVDNESNLSQEGNCWIDEDAVVRGNAVVSDDALVIDRSIVCGDAVIRDNAIIGGSCQVSGHAIMQGNAKVDGFIWVCGNTILGLPRDKSVDSNGNPIDDFDASYKGNGSIHITRYTPVMTTNFTRCNLLRIRLKTMGKVERKELGERAIGATSTSKKIVEYAIIGM